MIFDFLKDIDNYETRKVAKDEVSGLEVSTAFTSDEGYETAILDENGAHAVERYASKEEAETGHKKWLEKAKDLSKITVLGGLGGMVGEKIIILKRGKNHD